MIEEQPPKKDRRGGARPGAGRPRKMGPAPAPAPPAAALSATGVDALATLEAIMRDPLSPATARVAAAKALLAHKAGPAPEPEGGGPGAQIVWLKRDGSGHA